MVYYIYQMERKRLSRAPISEALIDIQVTLPPTPAENLLRFHKTVEAEYPTKEELIFWNAQFQVSKKGVETDPGNVPTSLGYRFRSIDGRNIVQTRVNGFTFSRLAPYESWEPFQAKARLLWQRYADMFQPVSINRVALRYINRIPIQVPCEIKDYVLTYPEISPRIPDVINELFMRIVIPDPESGSSIILTEALEPGPGPSSAQIVLDIDVSREGSGLLGQDELWQQIDVLREVKNRIFFNTITERTEEMLK